MVNLIVMLKNDVKHKKIALFTLPKLAHYNFYDFLSPCLEGLFTQGLLQHTFIKIFALKDIEQFIKKKQYKEYIGCIAMVDRLDHPYARPWKKLQTLSLCINLMNKGHHPEENYVTANDAAAMYAICSHAYEEGFRKFGFISKGITGWANDRLNAFKNFCKSKKDIISKPSWNNIETCDKKATVNFTESEITGAIYNILSKSDRPDILMCINDNAAVLAIECANSLGLRVPGDIGITGYNFNYNEHTYLYYGELTSVQINCKHISKLAINILHEMLTGERPDKGQHILIVPKLIIGSTSLKKSYNESIHEEQVLKNNISQYIVSNIDKSNAEITKGLLSYFGYSRNHLSSKFRSLFPTSLIKYINSIKIDHAAEELSLTHKPILTILMDYGFNSYQIFQQHFIKQYGMQPNEYRKKNQHVKPIS
jgi:DNA-binding LacI/PurR family transcriptional regulator